MADRERVVAYKGPGSYMAQLLSDGADHYYGQLRAKTGSVPFPGLGRRMADLGVDLPYKAYCLPPPQIIASPQADAQPAAAAKEPELPYPLVIVDQATTGNIRGWALDSTNPTESVHLHFFVGGLLVWHGTCSDQRPDVKAAGAPIDSVGFDIRLPRGTLRNEGSHLLTVRDGEGRALPMSVGGNRCEKIVLSDVEPADPETPIYSHIDSIRNGRVHGWALRTVVTPEGARLLGCCTLALVHDGRIVSQTVADIVRTDVADAMHSEEKCGFTLEVPRSVFATKDNRVVRILVMPERHELAGSPCVLARSFPVSHA
jgi:hypothetical protein